MDEQQQDDRTLEQIERKILASVKFIDIMLKEIKSENERLQDGLGMSYAKYIGLVSPFEEAIHHLRKVRNEFDFYLQTARSELVSEYKRGCRSKEKKGK